MKQLKLMNILSINCKRKTKITIVSGIMFYYKGSVCVGRRRGGSLLKLQKL